MQPQTQHTELQPGWQRLVGTRATEATHPALPGIVVSRQATFEWLEDQHCFDPRGGHRVFAVDFTADTWRFWNDAPGFSQRFTHPLSDDGNAIDGRAELSTDDGITREPDLTITHRRAG